MTDTTALDSFLDKWRLRWPEWRVVEVFVPVAQRPLALAWFALLQEFTDAMNVSGDPLPADAKLAWWGEELRSWQQQRSRHPLGRLLEPQRAPWFELAEALPTLQRMRERPRDATSAWTDAQPLALAITAVEAVLFATLPDADAVEASTAQLLYARLENAGDAALPFALDADGQSAQLAWANSLLRQWPVAESAGVPRKLWSALARSRLQRFSSAEAGVAPLSPARALWLGWRAARRR